MTLINTAKIASSVNDPLGTWQVARNCYSLSNVTKQGRMNNNLQAAALAPLPCNSLTRYAWPIAGDGEKAMFLKTTNQPAKNQGRYAASDAASARKEKRGKRWTLNGMWAVGANICVLRKCTWQAGRAIQRPLTPSVGQHYAQTAEYGNSNRTLTTLSLVLKPLNGKPST